jgi:hypothetical protein
LFPPIVSAAAVTLRASYITSHSLPR